MPPLPPIPVEPVSVFAAVASYANSTVVSAATPTPIVFNAIRAGNADSSLNTFNGAYVAPAKGLYQFEVTTSFAPTAGVAATVTVALVVDGTAINTRTLTTSAVAGQATGISFSSIVNLNQSSSVQVVWSSTVAGAAALQTALFPAAAPTWFQGKSLF